MKTYAMSTLFGLLALLCAADAMAASQKPSSPVGSNVLYLRTLSADDPACAPLIPTDVDRESLGGAVLTAVLPKAVEAGLDSLAAALRKASGEDDKTATSVGMVTAQAYDYDVKTKAYGWSSGFTCLVAETSSKEFQAEFVLSQSQDRSAISARLATLTYKKPLKPGKELLGMTMALILKAPDGAELANGIISGPFVNSETKYVAAAEAQRAITTPWMPMPPLSQGSKDAVATYEEQCAIREEAIRQVVDAEKAKPKGPQNKNLKLNYLPDMKCDGLQLPPEVPDRSRWIHERESQLDQLHEDVSRQGPITVQLVVTETRDVNKFLLNVSEVLAGSKEALKTALVENLDPAKRAEARKEAEGFRQDYEIALAQFEEKVRLYKAAVVEANKAEQKLAEASGDDAMEKAQEAAEVARAERAATFEAALTARKAARSAAYDAGISVGPESPLATFPD